MSDWIDATKRLPERSGEYIVNVGMIGVTTAEYRGEPFGHSRYDAPLYWGRDGQPMPGAVTHWMPLPAGPHPMVANHSRVPTGKLRVPAGVLKRVIGNEFCRLPDTADPPPDLALAINGLANATREEARRQGWWAHALGAANSGECPYPFKVAAWDWWMEGWTAGEQEDGG